MDDISQGVYEFSVTGDNTLLTLESIHEGIQRKTIVDTPIFDGDSIPHGNGTTSIFSDIGQIPSICFNPDQIDTNSKSHCGCC